MQLGARDDAAAEGRSRRPQGGDEPLPEDRVRPLLGEIGWAGVNRRVISATKGQAVQLAPRGSPFTRGQEPQLAPERPSMVD